jgi:hypothetical protein
MYQFATSETTPSLVIEQVTSAIDGGCKWIRLFGNNLPIDTIKDVVSKCQQTGLWQFFLSLVLKYLTLNLVESKFFITFVLPNTTVKHVRTN